MTHPDASARPAAVSNAVGLFYISMVMGAIQVLIDGSLLSEEATAGLGLLFFVGTFAVLLFMIRQVGRGRNWARITLLVLFLIGLPFTIGRLAESLAWAPLSGILAILQTVFQAIGLGMLFTAHGRRWFDPAARTELARSADRKKCPYCAEWIQREAIRCRYCGSDLGAAHTA